MPQMTHYSRVTIPEKKEYIPRYVFAAASNQPPGVL